tara:strand:+ start:4844 stop:5158 length:315 start_codon:yes stop_codon:yes gene_type:complete
MDLIYFILCAYGMTQIILYGSIFNKIRPSKEWLGGFGKLFHCAMCMGFWAGIFLAFLSPFCSLWQYDFTIANIFLLGCLSSGTSYILNRLVNDDGVSITLNKNE